MTFRYSLWKLLYDILDLLKSNLVILLILFVLNAGNESVFIHLLKWGMIAYLGFSLLSRFHETFFTKAIFAEDGIHIHKGLFTKSEQFLPREKIENLQSKATALHQLFGAQSITIETGEADSDVTLGFVSKKEFTRMEDYVLHKGNEKREEKINHESGRQILFTASVQDILKASLLSFSFLAIIPIGFDIWSDLRLEKYIDVHSVMSMLPGWMLFLFILFAAILAVGIGVFKTFNSYYPYKISMDDERIYVQKGWLSKQSLSIRKEKVQAVIYKQGIYQRLLGTATIKLISAGEMLESEDRQINEFFPYIPAKKAYEFIAVMLPEYQIRDVAYFASPNAKKLIWIRPPVLAILLTSLGFWKPFFFAVGAASFLLTYLSRIREYRNTAFRMEGPHVQLRTGAFTIETLVTRRAKLIELKFEQSVLQRICGVMNVKLTNRAHPVHVATLRDIDSSLHPMITAWFEARTKDVEIDPFSIHGSLRDEAVSRLLCSLKLIADKKETGGI